MNNDINAKDTNVQKWIKKENQIIMKCNGTEEGSVFGIQYSAILCIFHDEWLLSNDFNVTDLKIYPLS